MTASFRNAALLVAAALFGAPAATAQIPSPANSTVPPCISLVGSVGGVPDAAGTFTVTVRDLANNPMIGAAVEIDLSNCPDLGLCQNQLDPNVTLACLPKTALKVTNAFGQATFILLGGSNNAAGITGANAGRIRANGILIGSPTVSAYDLDGAGNPAVGANDLGWWLFDFASGNYYGRSDYDCSGNIGANDLSLWLARFGSGASAGPSCVPKCY